MPEQFCTNCGAALPQDEALQFCPECGTALIPPQKELAASLERVPFEEREKHGFWGALWDTWKEACFYPHSFFPKVAASEDLGAPLLFAAIWGGIGTAVAMGWQMMIQQLTFLPPLLGGRPPGGQAAAQMAIMTVVYGVMMITAPLWAIVNVFIASAIAHLFLMLFGGANRSFVMTARTIAYAMGAAFFNVVPILGGYVGGIWSIVLEIIGLAKTHQTDTWRAAVAVLLPILVCLGLCLGLAALIGFGAFMAASGRRPF